MTEVQGNMPVGSVVEPAALAQVVAASDEAIVLMAHGSRDVEGVNEFLTFAGRLRARLACPVYAGFLELADPPVVSAIGQAVEEGARTIIAVPWLLLGAGHVKNDLPTAIQWARERYPQVTIRYGTPINVRPELLAILADRLAAIDPDKGAGAPTTAVLLVQRGSSDPQANAEVARVARLLWEGRAYCTVEVAFSGITAPSLEDGLRRCLLYAPRHLLVVPYFLYTGVLVRRIEQTVARIAEQNLQCTFAVAPHLGQDVRLDSMAQRMIEEARGGRAVANCDMCQYRVPFFGREARVGLPQASDHSHGLRGTTVNAHSHPEQHHEHGRYVEHSHIHVHEDGPHEHTHEHGASPSLASWRALCECVTSAGIMDMHEITAAFTMWQGKQKDKQLHPGMTLLPYLLTAMPEQPPTGALRWGFESQRAHEFVDWCTTALHERFGIDWQIECEDDDEQQGPQALLLRLEGHEERCDWHYLNQSHWLGAFCTIADRLLKPRGVTALCLETGWFDTVIVFCRQQSVEDLLDWFEAAE